MYNRRIMEQIDPKKLKKARIARQLTLSQAAALIGEAVQEEFLWGNLANYENGFARPQPHILAAMCRVYNVKNPLELYSKVNHPEEFSKRKKPVLAEQKTST